MRIARLATPAGPVHVRESVDGWVPIEDPYTAFAEGRGPVDAGAPILGELLPPCTPLVVVGIAQNGPEHASPVQAWLKSPRSVVASGVPVTLRRDAGTTVAEGEIALVIGRETTGLTAENAHEYVLGVTAVNDLSSPDRAAVDPRNFEPKAGEGYTPLGPVIDTGADLDDVSLEFFVDGVPAGATSSRALPSSPRACLAYLAEWTTLGPGDVVMTGAPTSQAPIDPGAVVEIVVAGVRLVTPTR
ncbi:fumarylacetoacetate hydrolase family protein [Agromyces allii]|uniref:Fumarylacetoacetate hydrolase family protein n=1 Tax=Agromyces allii TaxID=393607 RepID=A0ABP5BKV3_9MICO|nr:fumarylacetoacetate hydrolase family protein [Agromyces allii]